MVPHAGLAELGACLREGAAAAARAAAGAGTKRRPPAHKLVSFPGWKHAMAIEHAERMAEEMAVFWRDAGLLPESAAGGGGVRWRKQQLRQKTTVVVGDGRGKIKAMIPNAARKPAAIFAKAAQNK